MTPLELFASESFLTVNFSGPSRSCREHGRQKEGETLMMHSCSNKMRAIDTHITPSQSSAFQNP